MENGMHPAAGLIFGWAAASVAMAIAWSAQLTTRRADWVDALWAAGTGALAVAFAFAAAGNPLRRGLIALLAGLWSVRLASHLAARITRSAEDSRYAWIRQQRGAAANRWLFWFFQVQALLCALFAAPAFIGAQDPDPLGWKDAAGAVVWAVAILGESVADRQLERFRASARGSPAVCRAGLWKYSRHPNYFFEWLHWWSYVLIGWNAPLGWLTLAGPALMLMLLFTVTGIPPAEARALAKRGEEYRRYQREVSAFVPWPPRGRHAD